LVTGGAGFLGGHIVQVLLQAKARVRVFDVAAPRPNHGVWVDGKDPVEVVVGDLTKSADVSAALAGGVWCVIHVASPSPTCRNAVLFQAVNVGGTRVLLDACRGAGVQRFVYTSSASVVFDGRDQANFDEQAPPPMDAMDDYTKSKLAAEQLVLAANDAQLWTCSIRPHGIFGARDPHFLPVLAQTGEKGKSKFLIGDGANLVDFTYVENVAYAHALAAVQLGPKGESKVNGEAFFITNREPIFFWEFISRMQKGWGYVLPWIPMPVPLMRPMAAMIEAIGGVVGFKPKAFSTQAINYAGCAHYYSAAKAVELMGYQPPISLDEAMDRSLNYYWDLRNKNAPVASPSTGRKQGGAILPPRPFTSHPLFIPSVLVALLAMLFASGSTKLFVLLGALLSLWFVSAFRNSVGATPRMFVENARDQLVSRRKRNIVVTGANRGLGFNTCMDLLSRGYAGAGTDSTLYVACRDAKRGQEAVAKMLSKHKGARVEVLPLDLGSFASIRAAVASLKDAGVQVHVLIHNAGAMIATSATSDGVEAQWMANYLGHFYFTQQLLSASVLAPAARIVNVSSLMHRFVDLMDSDALGGLLTPKATAHGIDRLKMYNRTKLAQIAWAAKQQRVFNAEADAARQAHFGTSDASKIAPMNRRTILSVNPGAVATDFIEHFIPAWMARAVHPLLLLLLEKTPEQGVQGIVHAALASELDNVGGIYLDNCAVCLPSTLARNVDVQEELWNRSIEACPKK
jgi:sterol-4alpha-carboxylate 3-dehydrogenase (decarboxylating)